MLIYGITGTQQPSKAGAEFIKRTLCGLPEPDLVVSGGCIGVDSIVGRWFADFTEADQHVILPAKLTKVSLWFQEYPHITFESMPDGTDYMDRNDRLVDYCIARTQLSLLPQQRDDAHAYSQILKVYAFPKESKEVIRSGTWATIRRFRNHSINPFIFPLEPRLPLVI
jgi:hypothetical protein